jgi:hypothetical protein
MLQTRNLALVGRAESSRCCRWEVIWLWEIDKWGPWYMGFTCQNLNRGIMGVPMKVLYLLQDWFLLDDYWIFFFRRTGGLLPTVCNFITLEGPGGQSVTVKQQWMCEWLLDLIISLEFYRKHVSFWFVEQKAIRVTRGDVVDQKMHVILPRRTPFAKN